MPRSQRFLQQSRKSWATVLKVPFQVRTGDIENERMGEQNLRLITSSSTIDPLLFINTANCDCFSFLAADCWNDPFLSLSTLVMQRASGFVFGKHLPNTTPSYFLTEVIHFCCYSLPIHFCCYFKSEVVFLSFLAHFNIVFISV